jgi:hypothetical protein
MSKQVVKILDPYRKKGVRGHIGNTDDFKHLAKKVNEQIYSSRLLNYLFSSADLFNNA